MNRRHFTARSRLDKILTCLALAALVLLVSYIESSGP